MFFPEFPAEKLRKVYSGYYTSEAERADYGRHYVSPSDPYVQFAERIAGLASEYGLGPGARIHEFGCGAGITVHLLRKMGFDATGSDWSIGAVAFANESGNMWVKQEDMTTLTDWSESLDMILNLHAIEHVPRPLEMLRNFTRLMGARSLLYLNTNQGDSIVNRRFGMHFDSWYYFPQHLHYFSPRSFEKIAERAGLKPLLIGTTDRWFDQIENALPRHPDETHADRLHRVTEDMANQEMEMLCSRAEAEHRAHTFETSNPEPADNAPSFQEDSHEAFFAERSAWSYWAGDAQTLEPESAMLKSDGEHYRYFSPAIIGEYWMMHVHEGSVPVLVFTAPRDGVFHIEVRAAPLYLSQPLMDLFVDVPGEPRRHLLCESTAPEVVELQAHLGKGDRVRVAARSREFPSAQRLVVLVGVRWLNIINRLERKVKQALSRA